MLSWYYVFPLQRTDIYLVQCKNTKIKITEWKHVWLKGKEIEKNVIGEDSALVKGSTAEK